MYTPEKIRQESVVRTVINSIKTALLNGELHPCDQLPSVQVLASSMAVSVASVREAIKVLEGVGLLESKQGKGTFVCSNLSQDAVDMMTLQLLVLPRSNEEIVEFRIMYETAFTLLAASNASPEELEQLNTIVSALEEKVQAGGKATAEDEMAFHAGVLECTHNPYVIRLGYTMLELFLTTLQKNPAENNEYIVAADHRRLYEAIKTKDSMKIMDELSRNFSGWKQKYIYSKAE